MTSQQPDPRFPVPVGHGHQCKAHNRAGERCGNQAIYGATVCRLHGGAAPQTQRAAKLRLLELVDPAIATLAKEMINPKARPIERVKAAEAVLDRAGYPKQVEVTEEATRDLLVERLIQLRNQVLAEAPVEHLPIEGDTGDDDQEAR